MPTVNIPCYSSRLDRALLFAAERFRHRVRKGSEVPYLTHLLQVMVTVGENGGDEDQMIAAVLHDYLEDIEGAARADLVEAFGGRVADMVEALSDSTTHPKPPWTERKEQHLASLRTAPAEVKLIYAADKLHNARSIVRDHRKMGETLWDRFMGHRDRTLWYYREAVEAAGHGWAHGLLEELRRTVKELHVAVGEPYGERRR